MVVHNVQIRFHYRDCCVLFMNFMLCILLPDENATLSGQIEGSKRLLLEAQDHSKKLLNELMAKQNALEQIQKEKNHQIDKLKYCN